MFKIIAISVLSLVFLFNLFINIRDYRSRHNPIPTSLVGLYDETTYARWKEYTAEHLKLDIIRSCASFVMDLVLIASPLLSWLCSLCGDNPYVNTLVVLGVLIVSGEIISIPFSYISTMKIEEKYGFNKTSNKTFVSDCVKEFLITTIIMGGLTMLYALVHLNLGDWILLIFTGILIVIILFVAFFSPKLMRVSYKFDPLPDGELKDKLTAMLERHGYSVRAIEVMKASERTTKTNAAFSGFGKMKTIILFDNMLEKMSDDEIMAVFAHEMGHGLHKDVLKGQIRSFVMIAVLVIMLWLTTRYEQIYADFGFNQVNYGMAFILVMSVEFPFLSPLTNLLSASSSRKAEYAADKQAFDEGYGDALISGLKKLTADNFGNLSPDPLVVKLTYDHPTLAERIEAIEKLKANKE